jgi:cysteinyl-tRNA synthetase
MTIQIENVLARRKEPLAPIRDNELRVYVCGVTVYGRCHVGHLRCYLSFDAIFRYLAHRGFAVRYVRNFTDIDDKIIERAREITAGEGGEWRKGAAYKDYTAAQWALRLAEDRLIEARAQGQDRHLAEVVADHFIDAFREDFGPFGLLPATVEPRVSGHMPQVIALVERIVARGFAYVVEGDVYFDVPAYHQATRAYGKLSGRDFTQLVEGARVAPGEKKRSAPDFALWKAAKPGEPAWDSPWGRGRPGWHIECSAMSAHVLGQPFDIHGGGKDLIFPHHENEIAQSEAATGTPFCNTWMHNGFVTVDGVKMSKSLGNFITIKDALALAPPEVWRLLVLGTHYANPIDFTRGRELEGGCRARGTIDIAFDRLAYFYETFERADELLAGQQIPEGTAILDDPRAAGVVAGFEEAMDDDFNTARAVAHMGEAARYLNELADMKAKDVKKLGRERWLATLRKAAADLRLVGGSVGLFGAEPSRAVVELRDFAAACRGLDRALVEGRIAARAQARQDKDFARSDAIRDELLAMGVEVRDTPRGSVWKVVQR